MARFIDVELTGAISHIIKTVIKNTVQQHYYPSYYSDTNVKDTASVARYCHNVEYHLMRISDLDLQIY